MEVRTTHLATEDGSEVIDLDLDGLTSDQLEDLRTDARSHGDWELVALVGEVLAAR